VAIEPNEPEHHSCLAFFLERIAKFAEAECAYREVTRLRPAQAAANRGVESWWSYSDVMFTISIAPVRVTRMRARKRCQNLPKPARLRIRLDRVRTATSIVDFRWDLRSFARNGVAQNLPKPATIRHWLERVVVHRFFGGHTLTYCDGHSNVYFGNLEGASVITQTVFASILNSIQAPCRS
jgi:hypothetical protein